MSSKFIKFAWEYYRVKRLWILSGFLLIIIILLMSIRGISLFQETTYYTSLERKIGNNIFETLFLLFQIYVIIFIVILSPYGKRTSFHKMLLKLPVSTPRIVAGLFSLQCLVIFLISCFVNTLYMFSTGREASLIGYGMFVFVIAVIAQFYLWYFGENMISLTPLLIVFPLPFFKYLRILSIKEIWIKTSGSNLPLTSMNIFTNPSMSYFILMAVALLLSYLLAVRAFHRMRSGEESLTQKYVIDFLKRYNAKRGVGYRRFSSPQSAQFWLEGRHSTPLFTLIVMGWIVIYSLLIILAKITMEEILECLVGTFIILFGFSYIHGSIKIKRRYSIENYNLDIFRATRPSSTRLLSYMMLKSSFFDIIKTFLLAGLSVAFAFLIIFLQGQFHYGRYAFKVLRNGDIWGTNMKTTGLLLLLIYATILISWICVGLGLSLSSTGRGKLVKGVSLCMVISILFGLIIYDYYPHSIATCFANEAGARLFGVLSLLGALICYYYSNKIKLIENRDIIKSWGFGIILFIITIALFYISGLRILNIAYLSLGLSALAILPFALAPMALHWNRHR